MKRVQQNNKRSRVAMTRFTPKVFDILLEYSKSRDISVSQAICELLEKALKQDA